MGLYLNPGNEAFRQAVTDDIYIDKTKLIALINQRLNRSRVKYICVSRPRRFGKSMAADMLAAYYGKGCDSGELFAGRKIENDESFLTHLNRHNVIRLDIQRFLFDESHLDIFIDKIQEAVIRELEAEYGGCFVADQYGLPGVLGQLYAHTKEGFIFIIDEWDCVFRFAKERHEIQKDYLNFLRGLFKGAEYVELAYMTGILPVKKYGEHSAINIFKEFSMLNPGPFAEYFGFSEEEAETLCGKYGIDYGKTREWYDGYLVGDFHIYNPQAVTELMDSGAFRSYWTGTETYEALKIYIDMNFEGLKDDVLCMIAGKSVPANIESFPNDMSTFHTEDDVLTLLVHLGYLSYNYDSKTVKIPNDEVRAEYVNCVSASDWGEVSKSLKNSADTLEAVWQNRPKQVAEAVRQAHFETSYIQYNDENALSYTISLALYAARNFYTVHREFSSGKGFADLVFLPRKKFQEKPPLVVELKWNKSAQGAIAQIKNKEYCRSLEEYRGNLLLVGVNYDIRTKEHECVIEKARI